MANQIGKRYCCTKCGAEFIVTPALIPEVVEFCRDRDIPVFPGAMSPTEIFYAHQAGAEMVKIFPASSLGPGYIKSIKGPFPDIPLMPTGGVTVEQVPDYFASGAEAIGVGGEIFNGKWMAEGNWKAIEEAATGYVKAIRSIR